MQWLVFHSFHFPSRSAVCSIICRLQFDRLTLYLFTIALTKELVVFQLVVHVLVAVIRLRARTMETMLIKIDQFRLMNDQSGLVIQRRGMTKLKSKSRKNACN